MDANLRSQPRRRPAQAMDGFINAPRRSQFADQKAQVTRRPMQPRDQFRTTTRSIGDFKRPEGYHAANTSVGSETSGPRAAAKPAPSLLQNSLAATQQRDRKRSGAKPGRDWRKIRRWSLRGGLVALGLFLVMGGFLFTKGIFKANKVFKGGGSAAALTSNVSPSLLKGEGDGRVNILLLGRGGDGHAGADLTDTILLASIDPVNKKAALLSIPRDLWVAGPRGGSMKINAVYATAKNASLAANSRDTARADEAGVAALETAVKNVLGVPIHYHAMVDFTAFKQAVDTVGGVDINVPADLAVQEHLWDETTRKNYYLNVPAGMQHFDGTRALFFTRSRHTSNRGDFTRAERQRLFIAALSQKVLSAGTYTNPVKVSQLLDDFGDHVSTDLSLNDAMRLVNLGKGINGAMESIGLVDPPHDFLTTGMINGQSVVLPKTGAGNYDDIQAYVRSELKDGYILKENANITILNGTSQSGLAGKKATELRTYGYNVGTVADAPNTSAETVLVDLTKGKKPYTKNYLERRFDVRATTKLPDGIQAGSASFIIILGSQ